MPWFRVSLKQSPTWRGAPPQMLPDDRPVWWEYLDTKRPPYTAVYYNLAMTKLGPEDIVAPKAIQEMWLYAISKRVDALGETEDYIDLIEVCQRAAIRSLGQIITYKELYDLCKPFEKPCKPKIVCNDADPDIAWLAPKFGIEIVELHPKPIGVIVREMGRV